MKPVTNRPGLPQRCFHCGAVDRKLIYEPDDAQVVRGICLKCRHEREKPPPRATPK